MSWGVDQAAQTLVAESKIMLSMEPTESISPAVKVPLRIKVSYLEPAQLRIPGPEVLINVVRRRVRQLIQGHRPLTQTDARMDFSDIALKEISEASSPMNSTLKRLRSCPRPPTARRWDANGSLIFQSIAGNLRERQRLPRICLMGADGQSNSGGALRKCC